MLLYFIRHGKPKVVNSNYYEAHLAEEGVREARRLAQSNELPKPEAIFTSPYNRAMETAKVFGEVHGVGWEVRDFLKEWNVQSLNLQDPEFGDEIRRGWTDQEVKVNGGESLKDLLERAYEGTMQIASRETGQVVCLVTHGTLMEMMCSKTMGRPAALRNVENMKFLDYAVFEYKDGKLRIKKDVATG